MEPISNLFGNIKHILGAKIVQKDSIKAVIVEVVPGAKVLLRGVKIKNGKLMMDCHPSLRAVVAAKKEVILEKLKSFDITDIQ